jgi:hypothetical protein
MLIPQVGDILKLKETLYKDVYILVTSLETSKRFFHGYPLGHEKEYRFHISDILHIISGVE